MPIEKLTATQLKRYQAGQADPEYVKFLTGLEPGQGGRTNVKKEGVSRPTIKSRLKRAAEAVGVSVKFVRSPADEVVFEVHKKAGRKRRA